jgi:HK97 gp10 family phage protein
MLETKITGLAALEKALSELPDKLQRNVVRSALRQGAKVIETAAKANVPVKSGKLRDSIRASVRLRRGMPVATIKAGGSGKGGAYYAHMVEFGTAAHFIKPKKAKSLFFAGLLRDGVDHPGAKKHPFMRTALDTAANAAIQAFADQMRARLSKQGLDTPDISVEPNEP